MLLQILLIVILLAALFPAVRRRLKGGLGLAVAAVVIFLLVAMAQQNL